MMARFWAQTSPAVLIQGTEDAPYDIIVQNVSANNVYLSVEPNPDAAGIKLIAGASYSNDYVTNPIWFYADVGDSEVRCIIQKTKQRGTWVIH